MLENEPFVSEDNLHAVLAAYMEEESLHSVADETLSHTASEFHKMHKDMNAAEVSYQSVKEIQKRLTDIYNKMCERK
ncbi:MAG: hypothetical protein JW769_03350 [Parachlamydiales bacterium]|nr:hypothetical protein [Parachlamydiales bacterium]